MLAWLIHWVLNHWRAATEPASEDQKEARKEYLTRVVFTLLVVVLVFFLPFILLLYLLDWVDIPSQAWALMAVLGLTVGLGWLLIFRGYWKVCSLVLPAVLFMGGVVGSSMYGLVTNYVLFYILSIQVSAMLWGRRWLWAALAFSLPVHFIVGTPMTSPDMVSLSVYLFISALMIAIALLQWFSIFQYERTLAGSNEIATNLLYEIEERTQIEIALKESEEKFRMLVENISDILLMVNLAGKITYISPRVEIVLGIPASELIGTDFISYIYPEDQAATRAQFEKIVLGQSPPVEFRVIDVNKKVRQIRAHSTLIYKEGKPYSVTSVLSDISTTRKAMSALRESENRLKTILTSIQAGVVIIQAETLTISEINPAALKMAGKRRDEVLGKPCSVIFLPECEEISAALFQKEPYQSEAFLLRADGKREPILRAIVPVMIDGKSHRLITFISIHQQKEAEEALRASALRYQLLAQHIPDGAVNLFDPEMRYVLAEGKEYRKLGIDPKTLIGQKVGVGFEEPAKTLLEAQIKDALSGNRTQVEKVLHGQYYLFDALPVRNEAGNVSAVMRLVQNITNRKRDERVREALYRISEAAHHADNLDELYRLVHLIVSDLIPAKNLYIAIYDKEKNFLRFPYFVDEMEPHPPDRPFGNGLTEYVIRTGQPLLIDPVEYQKLEASGEVKAIGVDSNDWLGVPLVSKSEPIGVLAVQTYTAGEHYYPEDRDILEFVSAQIAMVIARKQAEEAERQQRRLAEALRESTASLNSSLRLAEVLDRILENIGKVVPHDAVNIMLVEHGIARAIRHKGYAERGLAELLDLLTFTVADTPNMLRMMESGQPGLIPDLSRCSEWVYRAGFEWSKSYVGVPIIVKNELVGFINLDSTIPGFFTPAHADTLQVFADQAAIAIENARLYSEVEMLAIVDDLTGLYNRRGLFELGEREIERAKRFHRALSAMFIDIDHFKSINDSYGHAAGDEVLRFLAAKLRDSLREVNVIGRYGGEEFVVLLSETELETAIKVADRIRNSIQFSPVSFAHFELFFTISIGLIPVNPAEQDMASVCDLADEALYLAKQKGRNRIEIIV